MITRLFAAIFATASGQKCYYKNTNLVGSTAGLLIDHNAQLNQTADGSVYRLNSIAGCSNTANYLKGFQFKLQNLNNSTDFLSLDSLGGTSTNCKTLVLEPGSFIATLIVASTSTSIAGMAAILNNGTMWQLGGVPTGAVRSDFTFS